MEKTRTRPQSPHLNRNRSRAGAIPTSNINSSAPAEFPPLTPIRSSIQNSSRTKATTPPISRSTSTAKSRKISKGEENSSHNLVGILSQRYQFPLNSDPINTARKLKCSSKNSVPVIQHDHRFTKQRSRSATNSPSAWALSPGRTPPQSPMSRSLDKAIGSGGIGGGAKVKKSGDGAVAVVEKVKSGGGISGVLKYFRSNKKNSSLQEEAFHRYRVLHSRLIQWRLVNARAEISIVNRNSVAEKKLFNAWLKTYQLRNSVIEKRMQVQKLKNEIKLLQIVNPELHLLNQWIKIEKRNSEAVAKLSRSLMASSIRVPIIKGAKAETVSMYRVMYTALNVMNDIEETLERSFLQAEEKVQLIHELKETMRLETEGLEELRKTVSIVAALEAQEKSLRVYVIQSAKEGFVER